MRELPKNSEGKGDGEKGGKYLVRSRLRRFIVEKRKAGNVFQL